MNLADFIKDKDSQSDWSELSFSDKLAISSPVMRMLIKGAEERHCYLALALLCCFFSVRNRVPYFYRRRNSVQR
jgi:hypothetical protein